MRLVEAIESKSIKYLNDLAGKKVILRIDVNISLGENGKVDPGEDWRILKSLKTIHYLREKGAKVILLAHLGRDKKESLKPIFEYLQNFFPLDFLPDYSAHALQNAIGNMSQGSVLLLENLRQHDGEKKNDLTFLFPLIEFADFYVNEAFSVSHRKHASVYALAQKLPSYFGFQFIEEVKHLSYFLHHRTGTKTLILGGAKFGTKLPLLKKMLPNLDYVLMGGALANLFLRERGFSIGKSFFDDSVDISEIVENQKIILPIDYVDEHGDLAPIYEVGMEHQILDIGEETQKLFHTIIQASGVILWNGPMGKYEDGYTDGSIQIAKSIASSQAFSLTGGGDTSTVILEEDLEDAFDFISTGGGAMLDFLVHETLPGIEAVLGEE